MNKLFSILAITLLTSIFTNAQSFRLGAKAGANLSKIQGQSFDNSFELGYQLGGFAEIDFSKTFGIQPEILFSQTNTKTSSGFNNIYVGIGSAAPAGEKVQLNYLSIPILLRINASKLLTLHLGPQYSILINDKQDLFQNSRDAFKKGDFSMVAGAQLNLSPLRIYGRYNIGLTDLNEIDNKDQWKSQQIQVGVGLKLF